MSTDKPVAFGEVSWNARGPRAPQTTMQTHTTPRRLVYDHLVSATADDVPLDVLGVVAELAEGPWFAVTPETAKAIQRGLLIAQVEVHGNTIRSTTGPDEEGFPDVHDPVAFRELRIRGRNSHLRRLTALAAAAPQGPPLYWFSAQTRKASTRLFKLHHERTTQLDCCMRSLDPRKEVPREEFDAWVLAAAAGPAPLAADASELARLAQCHFGFQIELAVEMLHSGPETCRDSGLFVAFRCMFAAGWVHVQAREKRPRGGCGGPMPRVSSTHRLFGQGTRESTEPAGVNAMIGYDSTSRAFSFRISTVPSAQGEPSLVHVEEHRLEVPRDIRDKQWMVREINVRVFGVCHEFRLDGVRSVRPPKKKRAPLKRTNRRKRKKV